MEKIHTIIITITTSVTSPPGSFLTKHAHLMFKCACFVKKLLNFVKFSHFIFVYFKLNVIVFSLVITTVRIHNFFVCLYTEFSRLESRDFSGVVMVHRCIFYRFLVGK